MVRCPLFFASFYIFLIFLSQLNRKKSGKVGILAKYRGLAGLPCGHFCFEKWANGQKKWAKIRENVQKEYKKCPQFVCFRTKSGHVHIKVGKFSCFAMAVR